MLFTVGPQRVHKRRISGPVLRQSDCVPLPYLISAFYWMYCCIRPAQYEIAIQDSLARPTGAMAEDPQARKEVLPMAQRRIGAISRKAINVGRERVSEPSAV